MAVKIKVLEGDTWGAIAARELGNETLGREIAGFNGHNETGAPTAGTEVLIPHREAPAAAAIACANCGAPMPASAAYCSQCGERADGGGRVARDAKVGADKSASAGKLKGGDAAASGTGSPAPS
jgi:hypothetical protein